MKQYYGNYLGLCINNDDPQKRGRVQVFIPHIMPALYENWNEAGEDIKLLCVGDNIPDSLPSPIYEKLTKILPWAESASPIIGTSAPGNLLTRAAGAIGTFYNQTADAVASGINATVGNLRSLLTDALQYAGGGNLGSTVRSQLFGNRGGRACARGTIAVLGALTGNRAFQQGTAGGDARDYALGGRPPADRFQQSGIYLPRQGLPSGYLTDRSQWQIGDTVAMGGRTGAHHIQTWTGSAWVSDFQQRGILTNGYPINTAALHRLNPAGLAQVRNRAQTKYGGIEPGPVAGSSSGGDESTSTSGQLAASCPQGTETPVGQNPDENNYGNVARPEVDAGVSAKTQVRNFSGTQPEAFALMRDAAARAGSPDPGITAAIAMLESGHLGSSMSKRANNPFGQTITQSQIGSNGIIGGTKGRDGQLHAVYDSLESAAADHVRRWGNRYVAGDLNATTSNLVAGKYNIVDPTWASKVANRFNALSGRAPATGPGGLAGPAPEGGDSGLVNHPDPNGPTTAFNINNMANGVFSYPAAGAMLWVFFREGDPNHPVYFAANYGQSEWESVYRQASPAPGYQPAPAEGSDATSTGGVMNLGGVGGIRWEDTNAGPENFTKDEKSIMFYGYDGSNMYFNEGYHQIFSKFDRRDQVEGDRYESTLGFKEEWVQGESNEVVMGDVYVKIGNVSQPALDAVTRIQEIINEIMQPLAESKSSSGGTSESKKPPSNFTKDAEKNASILPAAALPDPRGTISGLGYNPSLSNESVTQLAAVASGAFNTAVDKLYSSPTGLPSGPRGGRTGGLTVGQTQGSEGAASSAISQGAL